MADRIKNYQQEADQITTLKAIRTDLGVTPSSYTPDSSVVTKDRVVTFAQAEEEIVVLEDIEKGVKQQVTEVDIAQKDIANIKALLKGQLYDYQTDTDAKYVKTVPAGAMPYAGLEKIGGKTVVWNQLVNTGTTSVSTISGHKYYTLINGTASIVTADGTAITVVDDTADMVCDLTLMFGEGNELSTTADFTAIFGATYYSYNAGTLLSAGVTEVVSKSDNLADYSGGEVAPSDGTYSSATKRIYTVGTYCAGITRTNFYQRSSISNLSVTENSISFTSSTGVYGIGIPFNCVAGTAYSFSNADGKNMDVCWYSADGTVVDYGNAVGANVIAPANAVQGLLVLAPNVTTQITYSKIQIEHGASVTAYSPVGIIATYPIPTAIRNLEGYGWSCPEHYNYIDYEAKKYVQEVGSRAYASGDESDSTVITDSTTTYYPLTTAVETDISAYLTDDNLINVEAGGTLTFPNSNGDDYRLPVPSTEEYMIDLQEAINNG